MSIEGRTALGRAWRLARRHRAGLEPESQVRREVETLLGRARARQQERAGRLADDEAIDAIARDLDGHLHSALWCSRRADFIGAVRALARADRVELVLVTTIRADERIHAAIDAWERLRDGILHGRYADHPTVALPGKWIATAQTLRVSAPDASARLAGIALAELERLSRCEDRIATPQPEDDGRHSDHEPEQAAREEGRSRSAALDQVEARGYRSLARSVRDDELRLHAGPASSASSFDHDATCRSLAQILADAKKAAHQLAPTDGRERSQT